MKNETFKVGDTVKHRFERIKGIVIKISTEYDAYYVKWNDEDFNENDGDTGGSLCDTASLKHCSVEIEKAEAKLIQSKIDEATAHLEAGFAALREGYKIETGYECDEGFHGFLENDLLDMSKFEGVVESHGWSTSSIYC